MKSFLFFITILFAAFSAQAGEYPWLKQNNPNSLGLFTTIEGNCPFSTEEINSRIEGEFLRARIKPTKDLLMNLNVEVLCLMTKNNGGQQQGYAVRTNMRFGTNKLIYGDVNVQYDEPQFNILLVAGRDNKKYIIDSITNNASDAITEYLRENFK